MSIDAIIQARTTSVRLPRKVLKELPYGSGITVLEQVIRRLGKSKKIETIIVATTTDQEDEAIAEIAKKAGAGCFRGSETDVLSRYYHTAKERSTETVVRITSDCPCIDPAVIDDLIEAHEQGDQDYTSNCLKRTYPHGLDAEIFSFGALERAFNEAAQDSEREHVTPYLYKSGKFKIQNIEAPEGLNQPEIRITLDTMEDYALLCTVFDYLQSENEFFGAKEIIGLFKEKPWLRMINEKVIQKKIFSSLEEELEEAVKVLDLQDLNRARDYVQSGLEAMQ